MNNLNIDTCPSIFYTGDFDKCILINEIVLRVSYMI